MVGNHWTGESGMWEFLIRRLWSKSRYPSSYGESSALWTGIVVVAGRVLVGNVELVSGVGGTVLALVIECRGFIQLLRRFLLFKVRE